MSNSNNNLQSNELESNFNEIVQETQNEFKQEITNYVNKKDLINQELESFYQDLITKNCSKELEEIKSYLKYDKEGTANGVIEGKEKEFNESQIKLEQCTTQFSFPIQILSQNIQTSYGLSNKILKKCLKSAQNNYVQSNNKEEGKIHVYNCFSYFCEYAMPASNSINQKFLKQLKSFQEDNKI